MILAGIDIGTNTIRLLIADVNDTTHRELRSGRIITRLGQDLDRSGLLANDAQERSLAALREFSEIIRRFPAASVDAVGTSALRNAANAARFIETVRGETGLAIRIISGEDEARLTLMGVRRALGRGNGQGPGPLDHALVIDIGGGSTELIATRQGRVETMASLHLGAVYLTERLIHHDPPLEQEIRQLRHEVGRGLDSFRLAPVPAKLAGTAGTVTTLAAMDLALQEYDPDRINGHRLTRASLDRMVNMLSQCPLRDRRNIPGLERGREDIILAGAVVCQEIMGRFGYREMLVSDWGLREGIVFELYEKHRNDKSQTTNPK